MTTYDDARTAINSKIISGAIAHITPAKLNEVLNDIINAAEDELGVVWSAMTLSEDSDNVTIGFEDGHDGDWLYESFPADAPYANTIIGSGAKRTGDVWRATVVGAMAATKIVEGHRYEAIGQGALRHTRYVERSTVTGTLAGQWGGADLSLDPLGRYYYHDIAYNLGVTVWDPAWDFESLETNNPGIRAQIAAWFDTNPWATATTDFARNTFYGRDSGVQIIKGVRNANSGYRSGALGLFVNYCSNFGESAGHDNLFGDGNSTWGNEAGRGNQTGHNNTAGGRQSLYHFRTNSRNTGLGYRAGWGASGGDKNLYLGPYSGGHDIAVSHAGRFYVQSDASFSLLVGDLVNGKLGLGKGLLYGDLSAIDGLILRQSAAVGGAAYNSANRMLVLESSTGNTGMTIKTTNAYSGGIAFADDGDNNQGLISYDHATDIMEFRANNAAAFRLGATEATSLLPLVVPDDPYAPGWDGSTHAPTKNAVFDLAAQFRPTHVGFAIEFPDNKTYVIRLKSAIAGTITETTTKCSSGSCTATFKINGVNLGGTANAVSSSEQSRAHSSANVVAVGDDIEVTISGNSSCLDLVASILMTRTLS
jgi:hypothetical protein